MTISDWRVRKLPEGLRRELFLFVPRVTLIGMEESRFRAVMDAHGRRDLANAALREMGITNGRES